MTKMNWNRVRAENVSRRSTPTDLQHDTWARNRRRAGDLASCGISPHDVETFMQALAAYVGTNAFLLSLQNRARAYGLGWMPTVLQLQAGRKALGLR